MSMPAWLRSLLRLPPAPPSPPAHKHQFVEAGRARGTAKKTLRGETDAFLVLWKCACGRQIAEVVTQQESQSVNAAWAEMMLADLQANSGGEEDDGEDGEETDNST